MRIWVLVASIIIISSQQNLYAMGGDFPSISTQQEGKIWANVPFIRAGNLHEFQAELSKTREQARGQLLNEFGSMLMPLAMSTPDVAGLAMVLANVIKDFDRLVR